MSEEELLARGAKRNIRMSEAGRTNEAEVARWGEEALVTDPVGMVLTEWHWCV